MDNGHRFARGHGALRADHGEDIGRPRRDGINHHVSAAGDVPHAATLRAIRECAAVLRTTHYDGDSISLREALELGTPVVATDNRMRPRGCHLIPLPPALEDVHAAVKRALAQGRSAPAAHGGADSLDAVLDVYSSLR